MKGVFLMDIIKAYCECGKEIIIVDVDSDVYKCECGKEYRYVLAE